MSCQKRKADKEQPIKSAVNSVKRACFHGESSSHPKKSEDQEIETNKCAYSDEERQRVLEILEAEFDKELQGKEEEIIEIQERIHRTQKILQYLCYAVVSDFYSREKTITAVTSTRQRRIHPAVKKLLSGKGPPGVSEETRNVSIPADNSLSALSSHAVSSRNETKEDEILSRVDSPISSECPSEKEKKVPRYIPPKPKPKLNHSEPVRGGQNKLKTILVVGNVSKWLPPDTRDDAASHKWMVYIRGPKDAPDISGFVSKVRFFLHPSYRPNDVVQVVCPPFQLSRRGWGEFPIRVQVHFRNNLNKPVDILHNLKLDRTYSGLQTLGAETVAEVWLHREELQTNSLKGLSRDELKKQPEESVGRREDTSSSQNKTNSVVATMSSLSENSLNFSKTTPEKSLEKISSFGKGLNRSPGCKLPQQKQEKLLGSSQVKGLTNSEVRSEKNVRPAGLMVDGCVPAVQEQLRCAIEPSPEHERNEKKALPASSEDSISTKLIPTSSTFVHSPKKEATVSSTSSLSLSTSATTKTVQTPAKLGTLNALGLTQSTAPLRVPVSPSKTKLQLVKCTDNKGNSHLLRINPDLLPNIVKGSNTSMLAAPLPSQTSVENAVEKSPTKQVQSHSQSNQDTIKMSVISPTKPQLLPSGTTLIQKSQVLGNKQVLRLVRPVGDLAARPFLVATNLSTPLVRMPMQTSGQGNKPLFMLKDGKLYVMKSALSSTVTSTNIQGQSIQRTGPSLSNFSAENLSKVVEKSCAPLQVTPSSTLKTPVTTSIAMSVKTNEVTAPCSMVSSCVEGKTLLCSKSPGLEIVQKISSSDVNKDLKQPLTSNDPELILNTKSSMLLTSGIQQSSPKVTVQSDQILQAAIRKSSTPQNLPVLQSIASSSTTPKISVKPGKSLLKPAVSVLKSNVVDTTTAPKVSLQPYSATAQEPLMKLPATAAAVALGTLSKQSTTLTTAKRIILGRTSGSSTITATSQKALMYQENLNSLLQYCPKSSQDNILRAVRWLIRNLPLVTSEAKHPEFKILYPYCAPDERTFCSWNIGKQRSCEWLRAKTAHSLLIRAGWDLENVWTTGEILLWARFHGYTPGLPPAETKELRTPSCGGECQNTCETILSHSEISLVREWLEAQQGSCILPRNSALPIQESISLDSDEEVDIEGLLESPSKAKIKEEAPCSVGVNDEMSLDLSLLPIGDMVVNILRRFGLSLSSEQIAPGVQYQAALRVLIQSVQSLAEDLARRAFADAWGKTLSRRPGSIEVSNVCGAICHRPEFDIFTCAGIGIETVLDTLPPTKHVKRN